jgi:hypothetical protein
MVSVWIVPKDAENPADVRYKPIKQRMVKINETDIFG